MAFRDPVLKREHGPTPCGDGANTPFPYRQELEQETFDVLWGMSQSGSETEGLFLRLNQKEYYEVDSDQDVPVEWMPDVRSPPD